MAMWQIAKARVLKAWGLYAVGQIVTLEAAQIKERTESGHAELIGEIQEPETAEAREAPENAALRTTKPKRKYTKRKKATNE